MIIIPVKDGESIDRAVEAFQEEIKQKREQ